MHGSTPLFEQPTRTCKVYYIPRLQQFHLVHPCHMAPAQSHPRLQVKLASQKIRSPRLRQPSYTLQES